MSDAEIARIYAQENGRPTHRRKGVRIARMPWESDSDFRFRQIEADADYIANRGLRVVTIVVAKMPKAWYPKKRKM